jgi:beta-aspartyl-peptidase (threonine type)
MIKQLFRVIVVGCLFNVAGALGDDSAPFSIAIHGGAGTIKPSNLSAEQEQQIRAVLKQARDEGYEILESGGSGLDAVIAAITILENSPHFNAGRGAVYTHEGTHELDASVMRGDTLAAGAVAGVQRVENPIVLARRVMEHSNHVLLSGTGAERFAQMQGISLVDNAIFDTEYRYHQLMKAKQASVPFNRLPTQFKVGTVGAVALDQQGNLFAGTSTGGMTNKRFGRIGDSPLIGAGTYADNQSCAVSATGHGEYFIRYQVASDICARVKYKGQTARDAADKVVHDVLINAGGTGGVIVVDTKGEVSMPFNTEGMYRASRTSTGEDLVLIYKKR